MRNPMKKITTVLVVVALLPVGFIVYELNALTENEKMVREIYQNQLDAILFSINQYSDDVINSWANRFNIALLEQGNAPDSVNGIPSVLSQFGVIRYIYFTNLKNQSIVFSPGMDDQENKMEQARLDSLVRENQVRINRLIDYEQAGFRKMDLLDTLAIGRTVPVFFVLNNSTPAYRLGAMIIDLPEFIEGTLGPKMQAIAQEKFVIAGQ